GNPRCGLLDRRHTETHGNHGAYGRARHAPRFERLDTGAGARRRARACARHAVGDPESSGSDRSLYRHRGRDCAMSAAAGEGTDAGAILSVVNLESYYGPIMALRGVSLSVRRGQIVTVLGANGAGKTTLMKTISGIMDPEKGQMLYQGRDIAREEPDRIVAMGIVHVPEGREVFPLLSVEDNLAMGAYSRRDRDDIQADREMVYNYFPILRDRRRQPAGTLSGGQQQMLAIGRGLMARPTLMLL